MTQGPMLPLLSDWQSFYMIIGTAAATLTGLMFVATSLVVGAEWNRPSLDTGMEAFSTPTVVHFGAVLLLAGTLSAPWQSFSAPRLLIGLFGLAAVSYLLVVARRIRRISEHPTPLKDWLWYVWFPLIAYLAILIAALALAANPALVLYIIAAALFSLLFIGIHNAWDLVTYFAVVRPHLESKRRK